MNWNILVSCVAILTTGCVAPGDRVISRDKLQEISARSPHNRNNWYYCGTDAENHHFITRIGGNTRTFIVPKEQIKLARTVPLPPPGVITIRQVDPSNHFAFGEETAQWHYGH